jgi:hypothetical protein
MRAYQISESFIVDAIGLHAPDHGFHATWRQIGAAVPGTRIPAVVMTLAAKPWCDPAEGLRAVQVAAAVHGIGPGFDWIAARQRMVMKRNAAVAVDRVIGAALRGGPVRT